MNRLAAAMVVLCVWPSFAFAVEKAPFKVVPGASEMSAEEKELKPDAAAGTQHGVILLEETERDDPVEGYAKTSYHLRAKIFSNEARGLADVLIPFESKSGYLREWWGRTILPDGTVLELTKDELKEETFVRLERLEGRRLKAALPGVVPGCVVDFGYVFQDQSFEFVRHISLQRSWAIRQVRYRWLPAKGLPCQFFMRKRPGLELHVTNERDAIVIEGTNLPPVPDEPWMPPSGVVKAGVTLYYTGIFFNRSAPDPNSFWNDAARSEEESIRAFNRKDEPLGKAIAAIRIPEGAALGDKLRAAYDWVSANVRNRFMRTAEERETAAAADDKKKRDVDSAEAVIAAKEGSEYQISELFVGLARALGAEANLVLAPDRTDSYWEPGLLSEYQLNDHLVAVRTPGDPDDKALLTAPGSGLPYGLIPWWVAPSKGLLVRLEGAREFVIRGADPRQNVLETRVAVTFDEAGGSTRVAWSAGGTGARGFSERRGLRRQNPEGRKDRLKDLCGGGGDFEVTKAEAPGLEDPRGTYRLECEGERMVAGAGEGREELLVPVDGAWIPAVPIFSSSTRSFPIVFSFPWIDLTSIDVASPEGYAPGPAPAPVKIESPFGSYALTITIDSRGYHVQRAFAMVTSTIKPDAYGALRKYLEDVRIADRAPLVFVKAGAPSS